LALASVAAFGWQGFLVPYLFHGGRPAEAFTLYWVAEWIMTALGWRPSILWMLTDRLFLVAQFSIVFSEYEALPRSGHAMAWLTQRDEPRYAFDPSSISSNFAPFHRDVGTDDVEDRIIAPVPDKSQGLKGAFIRDTYRKAVALVRASDVLIAIGYSGT
jgi:hypothetical protein